MELFHMNYELQQYNNACSRRWCLLVFVFGIVRRKVHTRSDLIAVLDNFERTAALAFVHDYGTALEILKEQYLFF